MPRKRNFPTVADITADDLNALELERIQEAQGSPPDPLEGLPAITPADEPAPAPEPLPEPAATDPLPGVNLPPAFERSLKLVLRHEGGYVDHPRDPGGATNLGISLRYARGRGSLFDLDRDGDVDAADIRQITVETAAPAYHADFWQAVRADELPPGLDHVIFDAAVNSGPRRAIRWLQHAAGAKVDGVFGPETAKAVAHASRRDGVVNVIERAMSARMSYLHTLENWSDFRRGWTRRVEGVLQEGHKIALGMPV